MSDNFSNGNIVDGFGPALEDLNTRVETLEGEAAGLPLAGGTMTGDINMDSNQITNLPSPTTGTEPLTRDWIVSSSFPKVSVEAGLDGTPGGVDLLSSPTDVASIICIQAYVTATGAAATKALLADTVDYQLSGNQIEILTDQSANTLVITYLPNF